jgi:hypothetical protein
MRTRYQARPRPTPQSRRRREKQREGEAGDGACDVKVVVAVLINAERDRGRERYGGAKTIARRRQKRVRGREETKAPENSRKKGGPFRSRRRFCLCVLFCSAAFSGKWWKRSSTAGSTERRDITCERGRRGRPPNCRRWKEIKTAVHELRFLQVRQAPRPSSSPQPHHRHCHRMSYSVCLQQRNDKRAHQKHA